MEDEERKVDLSHRTIQDEQARLRKKRQKAENVFAVFKKPLHESLTSVLPVMLIVLVLCFTIAPVPNNAMVAFLLGGVMLIAGMGLFTLGSEMSMIPLGQAVGSEITRRKKVWIITVVGFLIGMIITVAEPDLQVLANQVPAIENNVIIWSVAVGVGVFLVIALLRIVLGIQLRWLLIGFYAIVFGLAMFVSPDFWAVAFDSGGVTTGPMTVPFIMALGVGVCAVRSDKQAGGDSFGLVALCSIGPIITVLILGLLYKPDGSAYTAAVMPDAKDTVEMFDLYLSEIPHYLKETASALLPIGAFLILFQLVTRRLKRKEILHMVIGLVYVYIGLTIFLMGVNVGFMPVGSFLGGSIASHTYNWILIPIAMVIGYFIVQAEPAVHVLNKQVMAKLGVTKGMVVFGQDKLDEISMSAPTSVCEIKDGWFQSYEITPEQFGYERCSKDDLVGGTPAENAEITKKILKGEERGPKRQAVCLNAGAALYIAGKAESIEKGVRMAEELIDSGAALRKLEEFITCSNA